MSISTNSLNLLSLTKNLSLTHGLLYTWTELLYLTCPHQADLLTLIMSLNICKTLRKYLLRHVKGKSRVNFYIFNVPGQNFANSESCPILRLLQEAKICTFR